MYELEYVRRRKKKKRAVIIGSLGTIGVTTFAIVAFLGRYVGTFTVSLESRDVDLTLSEHSSFSEKNSFLSVNNVPSFQEFTYRDFNRYGGVEELDNEKGTTEESSVFGSEIKVSVQHDLGFDVDDRSRNINWIAGNEIWMVLYGMNVLKSLMIVPMDQTVQDATGGTGGANGRYGILKTYDQLEKGKQGDTAYTINYQNSTELFNWAVLYMDKTPDGEGGKSGTYVGQLHSAFNGVTLDRANYTTDATNAGLFPVISTYGNGLGYEESSLGHLSTFPFYIAPVSSHSADYDHLNNPNYATNGLPYVIDSAWVEKPGETWDQNNAWAEGLTGDYAIKHHDGTPTPYGWAEIGVFADGFNGIGYVIAYFPYGER